MDGWKRGQGSAELMDPLNLGFMRGIAFTEFAPVFPKLQISNVAKLFFSFLYIFL